MDVWIQYFEQNIYVLWKVSAVGFGTAIFSYSLHFVAEVKQIKMTLLNVLKPLTEQQSHGIITGYNITIGNITERIGPNTQLCYKITLGKEKSDQIITVSANNSAGQSTPSTIIPSYPGEHLKYIQMLFKWVEKVVFK